MIKIIYVDLCFRKPKKCVTITISRITRITVPATTLTNTYQPFL